MNVKRYFRLKQQARRQGGTSPKTELENLQVITAWQLGELGDIEASDFIGCKKDELIERWRQAVEAGKRLVR